MRAQSQTATCPSLDGAVHMFWQVDRTGMEPHREVILPKGTVEIIFDLHDVGFFRARIGDHDFSIPRVFISGHHTMPIHMEVFRRQGFFGINLSAVAAYKIFGLFAADIANRCLDLTTVDLSLLPLWHQLGETDDFSTRIALFTSWMRRRIPEWTARERLLETFLTDDNCDASVPGLAKSLCYSPRQLSRKFYSVTGMNTERMLLYKRYLRSLKLIHRSELSLTGIAHACGFSDQSHFIRTFRSFAGMRPNEYRLVKSHLPGHIFEYVR